MTQTFDIRFARSAGLAGFFEAPANVFRWKGAGRLSIDATGFSIAVKRGLLALFGTRHTHRISNENLRSVYREGEALRVEYETEKSTRVVLPFWAGDRATAAQIVRMLPTSQTVELEHSTDVTQSGMPGADWRVLLTIGIALAVGAAAVWTLYSRTSSPLPMVNAEPAEATKPRDVGVAQQVEIEPPALVAGAAPPSSAAAMAPPAAAIPIEAFDSIPKVSDSEVVVIPIARGTPSHEFALKELAVFEREAALLEYDYRQAHKLLMTGRVSPEVFAERLEEFEMRWWDVTFHIYDNKQLEEPELLELRRVMLGAARRWRNFLSEYASGLRSGDHVMIAGPLGEVARAQEMRARARKFVR